MWARSCLPLASEKGWGKWNGWSKRQFICPLTITVTFLFHHTVSLTRHQNSERFLLDMRTHIKNATVITKNMTMGVSLLCSTSPNPALSSFTSSLYFHLYSYISLFLLHNRPQSLQHDSKHNTSPNTLDLQTIKHPAQSLSTSRGSHDRSQCSRHTSLHKQRPSLDSKRLFVFNTHLFRPCFELFLGGESIFSHLEDLSCDGGVRGGCFDDIGLDELANGFKLWVSRAKQERLCGI